MRVGILQPNYIPWRGYFDFIRSVDLFILLDDVQYTVRDWRNRNRIKTPRGLEWLTVPVCSGAREQLICDVQINYEHDDWRRQHEGRFRANYRDAPYFDDALNILLTAFAERDILLSKLNERLTRAVCGYLAVDTPIVVSSGYSVTGTKTLRLLNLLRAVNATTYLSGPSAKNYLDVRLLAEHGIMTEWKQYHYGQYPQQWIGFQGAVTVLDLIANVGPASAGLITAGDSLLPHS